MPDTIADRSPEPAATIEIRLSRPQQLFNSLDPSPFHERDLDQEVLRAGQPEACLGQLLGQCDPARAPVALAEDVGDRLDMTERRLRRYFRDGRISLAAGLVFLFVCIALRQLALAVGRGLAAEIADEGLYIVGWVAMWRPLEVFLYDWRPIRHRARLYAKLARIPVIVRPT